MPSSARRPAEQAGCTHRCAPTEFRLRQGFARRAKRLYAPSGAFGADYSQGATHGKRNHHHRQARRLDVHGRLRQAAGDSENKKGGPRRDSGPHGHRRYAGIRGPKRALVRKSNSTDEQILSLLECNNEEVKQENSNKNPTVNSVQRDYMAGEVSKDITRRFLLDGDIVEAHEQGIIHFHDADYFAQHMHNCCLVNLEDMLQNGTVISETMIDRPKSFSTACNIATQAIAQIASSQYGGQSISLSHLAPFVDVSRQKFRKTVREELTATGIEPTEEMVNKIAEMRVKEEINRGVQMIQYQVITLMTTNGQAPFVTVFMYLDEVPEGQLRDDLAAVIEEVLHQRIQGVKNEKGVFITPAFPKLIYVLEEDNIQNGRAHV